jgi:tripartite-type tricarboxylate transporter receptor subunit TctC
MIIVANGMAVNQYLYPSIAFDPLEDFAPVSLVAIVPNVLVTNAESNPARTVDDVIAHAGSAPEAATIASAGVGTSIHLASEMFQSMTGVQMLHIPYRGSSPAVADLLTGRVDYMFDSITSAKPNIESGVLVPIAVSTAMRSSALPDVPTVAEAGVEGYDLSPWFGVFMPAGVPQERVEAMNAALTAALARYDVQERFAGIGAEIIGSTPDELAEHLRTEMDTWSVIIEERGIRAE